MLELFCLPMGQGIDAFSVTAAPGVTVDTLKNMISASPQLLSRSIPGHRLIMYQAKEGGAVHSPWLNAASAEAITLSS